MHSWGWPFVTARTSQFSLRISFGPERLEVNKVEKLIPNLHSKTKYVIHHETLNLYLDLGMKLTKIHCGISLHEGAWMQLCINLNTQLPTNAEREFEKDFCKLLNNSVSGKTIENIRKRVNVRLITNEKSAKSFVAKPHFERLTMFDECFVAIHMKKKQCLFSTNVFTLEWVFLTFQRRWCMTFVTIIWKINMTKIAGFWWLILMDWCMRLNQILS